ncbi:STAS domain-containing protein [Amycolatopsis sp. NPDC059657]|uniref:STAS domain-containing protein n=1 Tax=Amycolatopsis sp. NPDC059657 TaxID=3346899 RepID=UPI00366BAEAB
MSALFLDPDYTGGLSCTLTRPSPGVTVVTVVGEVDTSTMPRLADVLGDASAVTDRVILDLSRVGFLSCSALRVLHQTQERISLVVVAAGRVIPRTLAVTGMDGLLEVYPDLATAIAARRRRPTSAP